MPSALSSNPLESWAGQVNPNTGRTNLSIYGLQSGGGNVQNSGTYQFTGPTGLPQWYAPSSWGAGGGGSASLTPAAAAAMGGTPFTAPWAARTGTGTTAQNAAINPSGFVFNKDPGQLTPGTPNVGYKPGAGGGQGLRDVGEIAAIAALPFAAPAVAGALGAGGAAGAAGAAGGGVDFGAAGAAAGGVGAGGGAGIGSGLGAGEAGAIGAAGAAGAGAGDLGAVMPGANAAASGATGGIGATGGAASPGLGATLKGLIPGSIGDYVLPAALASSLALGNRKIPQQQALAADQSLQGPALSSIQSAQQGNITASQQEQIDEWVKNQKEQVKQYLQSSGQGADSTAGVKMLADVDAQALGLKQGFADQLFNQSLAELGVSDAATNSLINLQIAKQQQTGQSLSAFMEAYALLQGLSARG